MTELLTRLGQSIAGSSLNELSTQLLRSVPGLPPILQTVHLLSLAMLMGSIIMIDLRVLGVAVRSQRLQEMLQRLMPWCWSALILLLISGLPFLLARPQRYLVNPVFGIKFALLVPALILAVVFYRLSVRQTDYWELSAGRIWTAKAIALASLLLWLGVAMAGRWIAYSDYLFWPG